MQCSSLLMRCVSCMQQNYGFCFHIHSVSLCLFIGDLAPLILRNFNDKWYYFLEFVFRVCVCVCTCFLCFIGYSYPSCVWDFLLVFSVGLDLCIHIPWTWLCLEISSFLYLYLLRVCLGKSQGWHLLIFRGCRISICPGSFSFESPFWEFSHNSNSSTFVNFLAFFSCCF